MKLKGLKIGLGITGSFCNFAQVMEVIDLLKQEEVQEIIPIVSYAAVEEDTRFYLANNFRLDLEKKLKSGIVDTITKAEPIGPKDLIDILLICPCTGNTIAKLANGITDTPVLMAAKSHIRNNKPIVISISTNDGLGANLRNIGELLNTKNFYFVPFGQDDPLKKPKSLIAKYHRIVETLESALDSKQIQPVLE